MIETKEQYQEIIDTMPVQAIGKAMYLTATIEALREMARAAHELRDAMTHNKGYGETKTRLENAYGALWKAKHALPDWLLEDG